MASKINKEKIEDVFKNFKHVDKLLEEAAGNPEAQAVVAELKNSFEDRLKSKLLENYTEELGEAKVEELDEDLGIDETKEEVVEPKAEDAEGGLGEAEEKLDEYNYNFKHNYNYDGTDQMYEEEDTELDEALFEDGEEEAALAVEDPAAVEAGASEMSTDETGEEAAAVEAGASEMSTDETGEEAEENIEEMIAELVSDDSEEKLTEDELEELGYKEVDEKGEDEMVEAKKEGDEELLENLDEVMKEVEDSLGEAKEEEVVTESITKELKDLDFEDLDTESVEDKVKDKKEAAKTSELKDKVKDKGNKEVDQPDFKKMKKESVLKSKALVVLAKKHLALEDAYKQLKFENYKALKANAILTVIPELKQQTREQLVEKISTCKTYKEARKIFGSIVKLVKEHRRPSINEAVLSGKSSVKYINEAVAEKPEEMTPQQKRINFLSGIGDDDQYMVF